ncbi:MAG: arsenite methyltransferase [Chloroflexi bacterium]|nr:arsenite methyltransferase [Chloroflexota bacterium]MCL5111126.1 arsenite methyltransferase [Chloroflexota bacterium]
MAEQVAGEKIVDAVREHYAEAARRAQTEKATGCCSPAGDKISQRIYDLDELAEVPEGAAVASLGCGNPVLLADLKPGEVVLDLGSGGGIDVLLSARRVGPTGKAYGLDMTDEMLALARANAQQAGATNAEFLKGRIEAIPLPDAAVDVILSNCVINLSADKEAVLREAFRVLKPGGRFAVADIVSQGGALPAEAQRLLALWASCIAGALSEEEYRAKLAAVGFGQVDVQVLKVYSREDVGEEMQCCLPADLGLPEGVRVVSAFVKAIKPGG